MAVYFVDDFTALAMSRHCILSVHVLKGYSKMNNECFSTKETQEIMINSTKVFSGTQPLHDLTKGPVMI